MNGLIYYPSRHYWPDITPTLTPEQEGQCRLAKRRCALTPYTQREVCGAYAFFHEPHPKRHHSEAHAHLACPYHGPLAFGDTELLHE